MHKIILLLALVVGAGCENFKSEKAEPDAAPKSGIRSDSDWTRELIHTILESEKDGYFLTDCASVELREIEMPVQPDYEEFVQEHLKITNPAHLENQIRLRNSFSLTEQLVPKKKILDQEQLEIFTKRESESEFSFSDWLKDNCSNGYSTISKPVFNENYDRALVQLGNYCDLCCCGSGETRIYELRNGRWELTEVLVTWIT